MTWSRVIRLFVTPPDPFPPLLGRRPDVLGNSGIRQDGRQILGCLVVFLHRGIRQGPIVERHPLTSAGIWGASIAAE